MVWMKRRRERWKGANAAEDIYVVLCAERKGALLLVGRVLVGERNAIRVCGGGIWEERRAAGHSVSLGARKKCVTSVPERKDVCT